MESLTIYYNKPHVGFIVKQRCLTCAVDYVFNPLVTTALVSELAYIPRTQNGDIPYQVKTTPESNIILYEVAQSAPLLAAGMNGLEEGTDSMSVSSSEVLEVGGGSMPPSTSCRGR